MSHKEDQNIREIKHIDEMSEFQKEVVNALKSLGFKYKYNKVYQLNDGSMYVDISKIESIKDLFQTAFKNGAQEKVWEIKRVLEV